MKTEDLIINQSSQREVIEEVGEVFPDIGVSIFAKAFVVETIDLSDLSGLMVTSEDGNTVRVSDLESDEKGNGFNRVITSVNVVT